MLMRISLYVMVKVSGWPLPKKCNSFDRNPTIIWR